MIDYVAIYFVNYWQHSYETYLLNCVPRLFPSVQGLFSILDWLIAATLQVQVM